MATYVGDALLAHAKAGCYVCGRGDHLVDTDVIIQGEGALVLCRPCIQDLAQAGGLHLNRAAVAEQEAAFAEERRAFSPERVAELEAELTSTQDALAIERAVVERLVAAIPQPAPEAP